MQLTFYVEQMLRNVPTKKTISLPLQFTVKKKKKNVEDLTSHFPKKLKRYREILQLSLSGTIYRTISHNSSHNSLHFY